MFFCGFGGALNNLLVLSKSYKKSISQCFSETPIRSSVVDMIVSYHFGKPAAYPTLLQVHVPKETWQTKPYRFSTPKLKFLGIQLGNALKHIPLHLSRQDVGYDQVAKADPAEDPAFSKVKMFSPIEMDIAFVSAAHRDINKPELIDEWKRHGGVHQHE